MYITLRRWVWDEDKTNWQLRTTPQHLFICLSVTTLTSILNKYWQIKQKNVESVLNTRTNNANSVDNATCTTTYCSWLRHWRQNSHCFRHRLDTVRYICDDFHRTGTDCSRTLTHIYTHRRTALSLLLLLSLWIRRSDNAARCNKHYSLQLAWSLPSEQ